LEGKVRVQFSSIDPKLDDLDHMAGVCFRSIKFRIITAMLGDKLRHEGIWEDLIQEVYTAAWEAWQQEMSREDALRLTGRRINAFLKSYGFFHNGGRREIAMPYEDTERLIQNQAQEDDDDGADAEVTEAAAKKVLRRKLLNREMTPTQKILILLRESPQGVSKRNLYARLHVPPHQLDEYLTPLKMSGEVVEVKQQNTHGRYPTPLVFIGTAEIPEEILAVTDKREQIRKAYFEEGKSIKRIVKEYRCSKKTVHRIVRAGDKPQRQEERAAVQPL